MFQLVLVIGGSLRRTISLNTFSGSFGIGGVQQQMSLRPIFVLVGDSLTQFASNVELSGWGCLLQQAYVRSVDILNRGTGGYTTSDTLKWTLPVLQREWQTRRDPQLRADGWEEFGVDPRLVIVCLGANDAALLTGPSAPQHVPLDEYARNLRTILEFCLEKAPNAKVLVLTPPPVIDDWRLKLSPKPGFLDRCSAVTERYAQCCVEAVRTLQQELHNENAVQCIDLFEEFGHVSDLVSHFCDGLHFSVSGNQLFHQLILDRIRSKWPQLSPEQLPPQIPDRQALL